MGGDDKEFTKSGETKNTKYQTEMNQIKDRTVPRRRVTTTWMIIKRQESTKAKSDNNVKWMKTVQLEYNSDKQCNSRIKCKRS